MSVDSHQSAQTVPRDFGRQLFAKQILNGGLNYEQSKKDDLDAPGLKVFVHVINKIYQTGRKVSDTFKSTMRLVFDETLPRWNYCAIPMGC